MGRRRRGCGPLPTPVTDLLVGQLHYRWPGGHLGACWSSIQMRELGQPIPAHLKKRKRP